MFFKVSRSRLPANVTYLIRGIQSKVQRTNDFYNLFRHFQVKQKQSESQKIQKIYPISCSAFVVLIIIKIISGQAIFTNFSDALVIF